MPRATLNAPESEPTAEGALASANGSPASKCRWCGDGEMCCAPATHQVSTLGTTHAMPVCGEHVKPFQRQGFTVTALENDKLTDRRENNP